MKSNQKTGGQIRAILSVFTLIASTTLFFIPVLFIGLFKLLPGKRLKIRCSRWVDAIANCWCSCNNRFLDMTHPVNWEISGLDHLKPNDSYLLVANHQSWLDIVVLQKVFTGKIPAIKFFIKDELKWVPLLGFAWWAMGCPFMKRYSKEYLEKNPHKSGKDMESTRKAVEIIKHQPATLMNFIEGTRFTANKKSIQQSPYQHLLKPKAGGIGFVINAMGKQIGHLLDVTIVYSEKKHSLWDFLCHRIENIKVFVRTIPIPEQFYSVNFTENQSLQVAFRNWINTQWLEKDQLIQQLSG